MKPIRFAAAARVLCTAAALAAYQHSETSADAHGFVGDRFFPATITTEDPFAVDELSLGATYFKNPAGEDEAESRQIDGGIEFVKEIFPRFAVGIEETYVTEKAHRQHATHGWDNLGLSIKYELWQSDVHEAIVSIGLDTDIGASGSKRIGESFTTLTPTIYIGKGFGDLPDRMAAMRPMAITGVLGQTFPTRSDESNSLEWGFALEYSVPYLQQRVRDLGLPEPFRNMIPLVEFSFETNENHGPIQTTGTINPGILWETKAFQFGIEGLIPINRESGRHVGLTLQLQIYIDDLLPKVFGHPVFGER